MYILILYLYRGEHNNLLDKRRSHLFNIIRTIKSLHNVNNIFLLIICFIVISKEASRSNFKIWHWNCEKISSLPPAPLCWRCQRPTVHGNQTQPCSSAAIRPSPWLCLFLFSLSSCYSRVSSHTINVHPLISHTSNCRNW